jgi:hypothetical protein
MLIVYKFNFKLSIIGFLFVFRRDEKLHDVILGEQGTAQDSHDLYDGTSKLEVVLNDPDETVCDDGNMDLNSHGIVTLSPERLDLEVLLDPFEKQLDLPSVFIKESDVLGCKIGVVRVVSERAVQLRSIVDDTSDFARILLLVLLLRKDDGLVTQYIVLSIKNVFTSNNFVLWTSLLTDDEEGSGHGNLVKSGEVKVAPVKDIARQRLVCEPVHSIDIMHVGVGDSVEHRNLRDNVHLSVDLDTRLRASELRPGKKRHAEVDGCRVHCIEPAVQLKLFGNPSLLRKKHHVEGKLLKDVVVSEIVSLGKRALVNGRLSESEMKRLLSMSSCYICKLSQPFASHELSEHKDEKLAPWRRNPFLGPVVGLGHKALEIPLWQKAGDLSENVLSGMHIYTKSDLAAKVRISKVRQGFRDLLCCA